MTPGQHAELVAIIGLANETNAQAVALDLQIDERFRSFEDCAMNTAAVKHPAEATSAKHYRWEHTEWLPDLEKGD